MSIADKLTTIADNMQKVYEAGKSASGGGDWLSYDEFWDGLQQNGERRNYWGAFAGWRKEAFKPKYPIITDNNNNYMFRNSTITEIEKVTVLGTTVYQVFYGATYLVTACLSIPNGANSFNGTFVTCKSLENLTIEGEIRGNGLDLSQAPLLTKQSLLNILNALKDFSTLQTVLQSDPHILSEYTPSVMDIYTLIEGKTYITNYWTEETDILFDNVEQKAHKVYVEGYGEKIGLHYSADYWVYPDDYTFNLIIFNGDIDDGTGEPFIQEYRYLQNKTTGEISLMGSERNGDKISVYTKGGDGSHTVTLGATNLAKLTDAEKMQATEKGWELKQ